MKGKRKFALALTVLLSSIGMVFAGRMDAGAWVTVATLVLGIYGAANVADKKLGGAG